MPKQVKSPKGRKSPPSRVRLSSPGKTWWKNPRVYIPGISAAVLALGFTISWQSGHMDSFWDDLDSTLADNGLKVSNLTIKHHHRTTATDVKEALGLPMQESIMRFNVMYARENIEALPWVRSASVKRQLPDTVEVTIKEKSPLAKWQYRGTFHLIDTEGHVVQGVGINNFHYLPQLIGKNAPKAAPAFLKKLKGWPELHEQLKFLIRQGDRRWDITLNNGIVIKLPEKGIDAALKKLTNIEEKYSMDPSKIVWIDLRQPMKPLVRLKKTVAENIRKEMKQSMRKKRAQNFPSAVQSTQVAA